MHSARLENLRRLALASTPLAAALLLGSCAATANELAGTGAPPAGFLLGLWHGFIAVFAFIGSFFVENVGIYEVHNNGGWYDFGFLIGVSMFFGGSGSGAASRRR